MKRSMIVVVIVPTIFIGIFVLSGCLAPISEPPRRHDCPSESLLLDVSVFPEGTVADVPLSPLPDGGGTSIAVSMGNGEIDASHFIYPYRTPQGAEERFAHELDSIDKNYGEMTTIDLSHLALRADRYIFKCSIISMQPRCFYIARYDNFFVLLILHALPLDTPVEVLLPAIQDIDRRMMRCFEEYPAP